MTVKLFPALALCLPLCAQPPSPTPAATSPAASAQPTVGPDTVVVMVNGKPMTAAQVDAMIALLPPQAQTMAMSDKKGVLERVGLLQLLAAAAEKAKLDEKQQYKERLDYQRMQLLAQAQMSEYPNAFPIMPEDQQKYYQDNKTKYQEMRVRIIYLPFYGSSDQDQGAKQVTEADVKRKADALVKQARAGADYVKLVKENSKDPNTTDKDGEVTFKASEPLPEDIKSTLLSLKDRQISEPVRQANGYYIFKMEQLSTTPYEKVRDEIYIQLRQDLLNKYLEQVRKTVTVKVETPAYFEPAVQTTGPALGPGSMPASPVLGPK